MIGVIVRLLGTKTGEISPNEPIRFFAIAFEVVSEAIGLSLEEIRAQSADGTTLAEIIETLGGDVESVHLALVEALSELPNAADRDLDQLASQWLGLNP